MVTTTVQVNSPTLIVTSFSSSSTGFTATFNEPFINSATNPLHLYTSTANPLGAPVVTLVGANTGNVVGSLVVNSTNTGFTFIKTDEIAGLVGNDSTGLQGLLAADTYTVTLVSGANGFEALNGTALGGNLANVPGTNYTTTFVVTSPPPAAVVVSIPDFARGPDGSDSINLPNNINEGIPLQVSNGAGLTSGTFTVTYDPTLLNITGAFANPALSGNGAALTVMSNSTTGGVGTLVLSFSDSVALSAGPVVLGGLAAYVPATAPYTTKTLLQISSTLFAGATPVASINDNAVQIVAYQGDTGGLGLGFNQGAGYTGADSTLVLRASTFFDGSNSGIGSYETLDPVILGDIDNDGKLTGNDAALLANAQSSVVPQIANRPGRVNVSAGPDPTLSLPGVLTASANGTVLVPVNIDDPKPVGSNGMLSAQLALRFDPSEFTVTPQDVQLGSVLAGNNWTVQTVVDQSTGALGITVYGYTPITNSTGGSLVTIDLHEKPMATPASTPIALVASVNLNGHSFSTMVDDVNGPFTLTPAPSNSGNVPSQIGTAVLPGAAIVAANVNSTEQSTGEADALVFENTVTAAADAGSASQVSTATTEVGTTAIVETRASVAAPVQETEVSPGVELMAPQVVPTSALTNAPAALIETGREQNTQAAANSSGDREECGGERLRNLDKRDSGRSCREHVASGRQCRPAGKQCSVGRDAAIRQPGALRTRRTRRSLSLAHGLMAAPRSGLAEHAQRITWPVRADWRGPGGVGGSSVGS